LASDASAERARMRLFMHTHTTISIRINTMAPAIKPTTAPSGNAIDMESITPVEIDGCMKLDVTKLVVVESGGDESDVEPGVAIDVDVMFVIAVVLEDEDEEEEDDNEDEEERVDDDDDRDNGPITVGGNAMRVSIT